MAFMSLLRIAAICYLVCTGIIVPGRAYAESLLLIPGYLGAGSNWRTSGITEVLQQAGWQDGGQLKISGARVRVHKGSSRDQSHRFYTLDLPTEAPLLVQSAQLDKYVTFVRRQHPGNALVFAGHSAGGVLARLYMVQHQDSAVVAMISIASPHRGTESAELGMMAGQSPLGWLSSMLGIATLNRSQALYHDLMRENPGNLLGWLNHQPHPPALYVSVVRRRDDETFGLGNLLVPAWSQDLNQVFALRGRARTITVEGGHGLRREDAKIILNVLVALERA
jgi:triacylglycerol lipase